MAIDEQDVSEHTLKVIDLTERLCRQAFADHVITRGEQHDIRECIRMVHSGVLRQLDLDRKDYATGRSLNLHIGEMAKKRTARQSGPVQLSATQR